MRAMKEPLAVVEPEISCAECAACCCRLEVLIVGDDVPERLVAGNDWGGAVMRRLDDGWCAALDRQTLLCSIYGRRPGICRDFAAGGHDCRAVRRAQGYGTADAPPPG
jgi:Fe-S-cluster containining protein